jgi:hypothetical protein
MPKLQARLTLSDLPADASDLFVVRADALRPITFDEATRYRETLAPDEVVVQAFRRPPIMLPRQPTLAQLEIFRYRTRLGWTVLDIARGYRRARSTGAHQKLNADVAALIDQCLGPVRNRATKQSRVNTRRQLVERAYGVVATWLEETGMGTTAGFQARLARGFREPIGDEQTIRLLQTIEDFQLAQSADETVPAEHRAKFTAVVTRPARKKRYIKR